MVWNKRRNLCSNHRFTCFVVMMMNVSKSYVVLIVLWACRHNSESHTPKYKSKMKFHAQVTFASVVVVYSIHSFILVRLIQLLASYL